MNYKIAHFSIDDCSEVFLDLSSGCYHSIFDHYFFAFLKNVHELFSVKVTLYCFVDIPRLKDLYCMELKKCDWILLGVHAWNSNVTISNASSALEEHISEIESFYESFGGVSSISRLHFFDCSERLKQVLKNFGVDTLLTADDCRNSYRLPLEIDDAVSEHGEIVYNGFRYIKSDFRIENSLKRLFHVCRSLLFKKRLFFFTHEWFVKKRLHRIFMYIVFAVCKIRKLRFVAR